MKHKIVIRMLALALAAGACTPQFPMTVMATEVAASEKETAALDTAALEDGEYSVEINLWNAANPSQNSMANNAIEHQATLLVRDGAYSLQTVFKGMTIQPLGSGYLKSLSYWDGSAWQPATILSSYEDTTDVYNDPDQDGKADYLYPKQLETPLINKNKGDREGYVRWQVYVPIMAAINPASGTQEVLLQIDWESLKAVRIDEGESEAPEEGLPVGTKVDSVDKSDTLGGMAGVQFPDISKYSSDEKEVDYANAINRVNVNGTDYSEYVDVFNDNAKIPYSWEVSAYGLRVYEGALKDGENTVIVKADGYKDKVIKINKEGDTYTLISQEDVAGTGDSENETVDVKKLEEEIRRAKAIVIGDKTQEAWKVLQNAIAEAEKAAGNPEDQNGAVRAIAALKQAIEAFNNSQAEAGNSETELEDGEYTLSFVANQEGKEESSMLQGAFDPRAKLTVKNGDMKVSMLNTALLWALVDFTIESEGKYPESVQKYVGKPDNSGNYTLQEFTIPIKNLSAMHKGAVLVTAMGGQRSDKGNYEKYTKLDITFGAKIQEGWDGYQYEIDNPADADGSEKLMEVLAEKGYDINGDGKISREELQAISVPLDLSHQGLTDISLLKDLSDKVTGIDLTGNKIEKLPEGMLDNLSNLKYFYAGNNLISEIPEGFFKNNGKAEWINLSSNLITSVDKGDLEGLTSVKELDLGNNAVAKVDAAAFEGVESLETLALNGNQLTSLADGIFRPLKNVSLLWLGDNRLSRLPSSIGDMEKLEKLTAERNRISSLEGIDFTGLSKLSAVDLRSNMIEEIQAGTFAANQKISELNLYNNLLTSFTADVLPEGISLGMLDIQMNLLQSVDDDVKALIGTGKIYPQLESLKFHLETDGGMLKWNQDMTVLDMSYWYDSTTSVQREEIATVEDYYKMLENQGYDGSDMVAFMNREGYDWEIRTEIQKKDTDGQFVAVQEKAERDRDDNTSGTFVPEEEGTYRIVKTLYGGKGVMDYKFAAVSNEVDMAFGGDNKGKNQADDNKGKSQKGDNTDNEGTATEGVDNKDDSAGGNNLNSKNDSSGNKNLNNKNDTKSDRLSPQKKGTVKTGDESNMLLWGMAASGSVLAAIIVAVKKKRTR